LTAGKENDGKRTFVAGFLYLLVELQIHKKLKKKKELKKRRVETKLVRENKLNSVRKDIKEII